MFALPIRITALTAAVAMMLVNPAGLSLPQAAAASKKKTDSLHSAATELGHAHAVVNGKKTGNAADHLKSAVGHIEHAIKEHAKLNPNGETATAAHKKHHDLLHQALHASKEAEKHLSAGNTAAAKKEIAHAHHHIEEAIKHKQGLTAK
jgi:gas vesicle protein